MAPPLYGAIEAGGTKIIVAVGRGPDELLADARIPTAAPEESWPRVLAFLADASRAHGPLRAIGLASFGPVDVRRGSPTWGRLLRTTKPGWSGFDMAGPLAARFGVPVGFDTDVNGAALGEARWGAARDLSCAAYVTVGTGVGGGAVIDGRPLHGLLHPEMGHVPVRRVAGDDFPGVCPFHTDCIEGMASGPAILARCGTSLDKLPAEHPVRGLVAAYLGQLCAQIALLLSPERIVLGGGVMTGGGLHGAVAREMNGWLRGYVQAEAVEAPGYLVPPAPRDRSGLRGALALAADAGGRAASRATASASRRTLSSRGPDVSTRASLHGRSL